MKNLLLDVFELRQEFKNNFGEFPETWLNNWKWNSNDSYNNCIKAIVAQKIINEFDKLNKLIQNEKNDCNC